MVVNIDAHRRRAYPASMQFTRRIALPPPHPTEVRTIDKRLERWCIARHTVVAFEGDQALLFRTQADADSFREAFPDAFPFTVKHKQEPRAAGVAKSKRTVAENPAHDAMVMVRIREFQAQGVSSPSKIARMLNEAGVMTARSGTFQASTVMNILARN